MKKLLNTLYITSENCYLSKEGENIVIKIDDKEVKRMPIHILEGIICFNYNGVSPGVLKLCSENNINLALMTPQGRLCGRFIGVSSGNVYLRKEQYRVSDNEADSLKVAKQFIIAKLINSRKVLMRFNRDYSSRFDLSEMKKVSEDLLKQVKLISNVENSDSLRGIEGESARKYFSLFDTMILKQKDDFYFNDRNKRPPLDNVNAMLSFFYSILTYEISYSLEAVGLDSYVGFFHSDRPGRNSLALDMIEELRAYVVDRFVLSSINLNKINGSHFIKKENGSVLITDKGRKILLGAWQEKKQEIVTHKFLDEKIKIGLIPHVQALLLARYIRGDLDEYPPFIM